MFDCYVHCYLHRVLLYLVFDAFYKCTNFTVVQARSLASDHSIVRETGGTERRKRVDLERSTDLMAGGLRVASHVHSKSRTEEGNGKKLQSH